MNKAINFIVDNALHSKIKIKAVNENKTIKQYILDLVKEDLKVEREEK